MSRTPFCPISNSYSILNYESAAKNQVYECPNICVCKNELQNILKKLNQLREKVDHLKNLESDLDDETWNSEINEVKNMQKHISSYIFKYKDKSLLNKLKQSLRTREKKRNNRNKRRARLKAAKQQLMENRKKLEEQTTEWVRKENEKVLRRKLSAEAAGRSEIVLYAVNKKISEAQRFIHLLDMVEKLRKCRNKVHADKNYGERNFTIKVDRLRNVWKDALSEYEDEKNKLKSFMSENTKPVEHQWKEVIFGDDFQNDSMNTEANSLHEFIEIRRTWDSYIVPNEYPYGSAIPSGLVIPNVKPLEQWSLYKITD